MVNRRHCLKNCDRFEFLISTSSHRFSLCFFSARCKNPLVSSTFLSGNNYAMQSRHHSIFFLPSKLSRWFSRSLTVRCLLHSPGQPNACSLLPFKLLIEVGKNWTPGFCGMFYCEEVKSRYCSLEITAPLFVDVWIMGTTCLFSSLSRISNFMLPYLPTVISKSFSRTTSFAGSGVLSGLFCSLRYRSPLRCLHLVQMGSL